MKKILRLLSLPTVFCSVALLTALSPSRAATLPAGFSESLVANGLSNPTAMDIAPDGRIFVCQQGGSLRVIKNGVLLPTPFVTVSVSSVGERGLLGVAFDPNFSTNRFVYIYYTTSTSPIHNRVSRFTANGDVSTGVETPILDLDNLSGATNHNGGAIHFGKDGKLYIAVGDNANASNAETLSNRLGKMLRINPNGTIPSDNPFFNTATGANRAIWALGLRNPFTFTFQPGSGRMFINDVGQSTWEEINDGIAGSNYGWNTCEGACDPPNSNFRDPIFYYGHGSGPTTGCSIAGGAFYNPIILRFPASYTGDYFFADLCSGWIRKLDPSNNSVTGFASGIANPVDLKVSSDGALYYLARGSGAVFKIQYPNQAPANVSLSPNSGSSTVGTARTFTARYSDVNSTGDINLGYLRVGNSNANGLLCWYSVASNKLYLRNDAGTAWLGGFAPGSSNVISNSQGSLNCAATTVARSGNTLTINWSLTPKAAFVGTRPLYLYVRDNGGLSDGYDNMGTWMIVNSS